MKQYTYVLRIKEQAILDRFQGDFNKRNLQKGKIST